MLLHILSAITQWVAGFFLGIVGLILMGDFTAWWRNSEQPGRPDAAGCLFLLLYIGALAVIRWLH